MAKAAHQRGTDPRDIFPCDDCKTPTHIDLLDAYVAATPNLPEGEEDPKENAPEAEAFLCKSCHDKRPPSAWGAWSEP